MIDSESSQLPNGSYLVFGPTASGKSEMVQSLTTWVLGAVGIDETSPTKNPAHAEYYQALKDGEKPNPHAFKSQLFFLFDSLTQSLEVEAKMKEAPVFWGGSPWHHFMYVHLLHEDSILSEEDYERYCAILVQCLPLIPHPTGGIHTRRKTGEDTRLAVRSRAESSDGEERERRMDETGVPIEYWQSQITYWKIREATGLLLPKEVDEKLGEHSPRIPIVTFDPDEINWLTNNGKGELIINGEGKQEILGQLMAELVNS